MREQQLNGEVPLFTEIEGEITALEVENQGEGFLWVEPYGTGESARMPSSAWSTPVPPHARRTVWKADEPTRMMVGVVGRNNRFKLIGTLGP